MTTSTLGRHIYHSYVMCCAAATFFYQALIVGHVVAGMKENGDLSKVMYIHTCRYLYIVHIVCRSTYGTGISLEV
jgi:hypothetical protein